jgi:hypothetical protein
MADGMVRIPAIRRRKHNKIPVRLGSGQKRNIHPLHRNFVPASTLVPMKLLNQSGFQ